MDLCQQGTIGTPSNQGPGDLCDFKFLLVQEI